MALKTMILNPLHLILFIYYFFQTIFIAGIM